MSRGRCKCGGWAAFDLKQRQKQGLEPDILNDPFPPLVPCQKKLLTKDIDKPFSSLLLVCDSSGTSRNKENEGFLAVSKLQELHPWADSSLFQDVLAAADNDMDRASMLLKAMVADNNGFEDNSMSLAVFDVDGKELVVESDSFGTNHSDEGIDQKLILERLKAVPLEPEWEEDDDDLYLIHRKDALKMMRSASQHSRAGTNAFLRDDHVSAQHHSLKARQQRSAAESLNAKAAKEIFSIRNSSNDLWHLDLHGLHAAEAIQALQERLQQIETQVHPNHSLFSNRVSSAEAEKLDIQRAPSRQRPTLLQVITGVGNHSRGHAAIPTAVRSYLNGSRYHFDELGPGVVTVRPKFRHR